jgi:hypothetical protein
MEKEKRKAKKNAELEAIKEREINDLIDSINRAEQINQYHEPGKRINRYANQQIFDKLVPYLEKKYVPEGLVNEAKEFYSAQNPEREFLAEELRPNEHINTEYERMKKLLEEKAALHEADDLKIDKHIYPPAWRYEAYQRKYPRAKFKVDIDKEIFQRPDFVNALPYNPLTAPQITENGNTGIIPDFSTPLTSAGISSARPFENALPETPSIDDAFRQRVMAKGNVLPQEAPIQPTPEEAPAATHSIRQQIKENQAARAEGRKNEEERKRGELKEMYEMLGYTPEQATKRAIIERNAQKERSRLAVAQAMSDSFARLGGLQPDNSFFEARRKEAGMYGNQMDKYMLGGEDGSDPLVQRRHNERMAAGFRKEENDWKQQYLKDPGFAVFRNKYEKLLNLKASQSAGGRAGNIAAPWLFMGGLDDSVFREGEKEAVDKSLSSLQQIKNKIFVELSALDPAVSRAIKKSKTVGYDGLDENEKKAVDSAFMTIDQETARQMSVAIKNYYEDRKKWHIKWHNEQVDLAKGRGYDPNYAIPKIGGFTYDKEGYIIDEPKKETAQQTSSKSQPATTQLPKQPAPQTPQPASSSGTDIKWE